MKPTPNRDSAADRSLIEAVRFAVLPEIARRRPERILLISPQPLAFPALGAWPLLALRCGMNSGEGPLVCESGLLPFCDDAFDAVLLHHVFTDGREPELDEAWRVLAAGGDLFVLGQGVVPVRLRPAWRPSPPALHIRQVCQRLRQRAFVIERCAGSGLLGFPLTWENRWQRPMLPLASTVVIHGRHRPLKPIMRPLRFGRPHPVGVRAAVAENLFRDAV